MTERPLVYLLRNRNFMLMWWAGLVSWVGNYMLFIALPVYVYGETGSTLATSFSVMANALPMIVVGQLAGVLVDRWDYRRTLLKANLALVGVTLLFLTVLSAPWWLVIPIAFVQSSVGQFIGPAENALLPTLVSEFFAIGVMVLISIVLRQKGSPESKPVDSAHSVTGES